MATQAAQESETSEPTEPSMPSVAGNPYFQSMPVRVSMKPLPSSKHELPGYSDTASTPASQVKSNYGARRLYTANDLFAEHVRACRMAKDLMVKKNHDYAGADGANPFANFECAEALDIGTAEQSMLLKLVDKVKRLSTFHKSGALKVTEESYEDTVLDVINYAVLLLARFRSQTSGPGCGFNYTCSSDKGVL